MIKSIEIKASANKKKYVDLILSDDSGEINSKYWDYNEGMESIYNAFTVIKVRGTVISYMNNLQFKIDKFRNVDEKDNISVEDFVPVAPIKAEDMLEEIEGYLNRVENKDAKNIVSLIIENKKDKLMYYPAAMKNHHSIKSGLLYHTLTMLRLGEKIQEVYPSLNKDLLFSGIILHDLAKIEEMESTNLGIVTEYTLEGKLLGHITQGIKDIEEAGANVQADKEIVMLLEHMVLSHHYEPEYGSPKKPMIKEAEMLHYIDKIDATMFDLNKSLSKTEKGEFTESIWTLDRRRIYNPKNI
ncbi:MAG: 3'-5' exoribonuclease YhaM family protein [Clostridiaceae bacterium]